MSPSSKHINDLEGSVRGAYRFQSNTAFPPVIHLTVTLTSQCRALHTENALIGKSSIVIIVTIASRAPLLFIFLTKTTNIHLSSARKRANAIQLEYENSNLLANRQNVDTASELERRECQSIDKIIQ